MIAAAPEPLAHHHLIEQFNSGIESLDNWLKHRALANQDSGASRTFVVCRGDEVIAYYALATSAIGVADATGRFRRNMPDPIPVVVLGRLAVSANFQRDGLGSALVKDATIRVMSAADMIGIRGIVVHAISDEAAAFYRGLGFALAPFKALTLMATLADLRVNLL